MRAVLGPGGVSRRRFLAASAVALATPGALLAACSPDKGTSGPPVGNDGRLQARPGTPTETITPGLHALGLSAGRDGFLWVPTTYNASTPAPLIVLLHGAGHDSSEWSQAPLADIFGPSGAIVMGTDSFYGTWDLAAVGYFGPDVEFMNIALGHVFERCNIDPERIALGGFSDGASYALSLGLTNGDLFNEVVAFSPGFLSSGVRHGRPRIFESHGTSDPILPIDQTSRRIVPALRTDGYDVTYVEFAGGHTVTRAIADQMVEWWLPPG